VNPGLCQHFLHSS